MVGAGRLAANLGAALTLEWHALDTLVTGWSLVLYGAGVLAVAGRAKPLRARGLFLIALLGILLDFGHHNYPSPQAHAIKLLSCAATMLAVVSLFRHVRSQTGGGAAPTPTRLLLRLAGWWTVFAIATGILLACPGSMCPRLRGLFLGALWTLVGLVASFGGLGVAARFLRLHQDYAVWSPRLRPAYALLPITGTAVVATFGLVAWDLGRRTVRRGRGWQPPPAQLRGARGESRGEALPPGSGRGGGGDEGRLLAGDHTAHDGRHHAAEDGRDQPGVHRADPDGAVALLIDGEGAGHEHRDAPSGIVAHDLRGVPGLAEVDESHGADGAATVFLDGFFEFDDALHHPAGGLGGGGQPGDGGVEPVGAALLGEEEPGQPAAQEPGAGDEQAKEEKEEEWIHGRSGFTKGR